MDVLDKLSGVTNVWVHRETVMRDLLKTYENSRELTQQLVTFSFHGEVGMDLDGLKREAYSLFWKQALEDYFEGSSTFVPRVSPEIEESTMRRLGRIISHQCPHWHIPCLYQQGIYGGYALWTTGSQ